MGKREGSWIQTYTGKKFWPLDPKCSEISIFDIAHSLSLLSRFNGHTTKFLSVAQHSVMVSDMCSSQYKIHGLLHDASEAYCCDIPSPLKPYIPGYLEIEEKIQKVIFSKYGLIYEDIKHVKSVDKYILATEARDLCVNYEAMNLPNKPYEDIKIEPWPSERAEKIFIEKFNKLQENIIGRSFGDFIVLEKIKSGQFLCECTRCYNSNIIFESGLYSDKYISCHKCKWENK